MLSHRRRLEIEWGDCDAAGIVFFPRYFAMFDASTAYLFEKALGEKKIAWVERYGIVGIPMVDTGAVFRLPSRYGDVIEIETAVREVGRSSIVLNHRVLKGEAVAIEAHEKRVWTGRDPADPKRMTAVPLPAEVAAALKGTAIVR